MIFALQNIRLEWHFLGIFEIAAGENNGRFSRKQSVKNFGRLVDAWRFLWILTISFFQICYSRSSLLYCLVRSVCIWVASIGLGLGRFLFYVVIVQRAVSGKIRIGCAITWFASYRSVRSRSYADFYTQRFYRPNIRKLEFAKPFISLKSDSRFWLQRLKILPKRHIWIKSFAVRILYFIQIFIFLFFCILHPRLFAAY